MKSRAQSGFLGAQGDIIGIFLSGACVVHCLLLPLLAFVSPLFATLTEAEWVHMALLTALTPVAILTLRSGYKKHGSIRPLFIGTFGLAFLILAVLAEGVEIFQLELEMIGTVLGSLSLCYAHLLNLGLRKQAESTF